MSKYVKRAPPPPPPIRLLGKREILAIVGCTYPTLWQMMRRGEFPRSRVVGEKSLWRSDEIDAWLAGLPRRPLKGDVPVPSLEQPNQS
jgi:predicted DNA-binding transcriptional regulator AlpA